ncbi:sigma-70 family RNA polymerase sigma factor [Candidatus Poribacteria bacterium]|nr:sigma-70 family RNA polymerase sigma factor [Candidatus Poribacteria bacterium]
MNLTVMLKVPGETLRLCISLLIVWKKVSMEHTDSYLIEKCLEGDRSAFAEIVERYKKQIYSITYSMTHNHADADDLSQDTFIKAYENLGKFKLNTNLRSWLCRIAVNSCIDYIRHKKRSPEDFVSDEVTKNISRPNDNPYNNVESQEVMNNIYEAVNSLPKNQKIVVTLREIQGMELKEIAEIMECSENTIRWRLHSARKKLQKKLAFYLGTCS